MTQLPSNHLEAGDRQAEPARHVGAAAVHRADRAVDVAVTVGLVFMAVLLVALHVRAYTKVSPIDEQMHIDYLVRAPGLQPVVSGTKLGEQAMREEACRGIGSSFSPPPCDSPLLRPDQFEFSGYNSAYIHPATYYDITAVLARTLQAAAGLPSLVTAARLIGGLWLAAGLVLSYLAARKLGAPALSSLGVVLLAAATPVVLFLSATVTPDSMNLLVGAGVLYLVLLWEEQPARWWLLVAASVAAVAVKLTNAVVLPTLAMYLILRAIPGAGGWWKPVMIGARDHGDSATGINQLTPRRAITAAGVLGVTSLVLAALWMLAVQRNAVLDASLQPMNVYLQTHSASLRSADVVSSVTAFLPPILSQYIPPPLDRATSRVIIQITVGLFIAGLVASVLGAGVAARLRSLGLSTLVVALTGGPLFTVYYYVGLHQVITIPPRYAMALLPAMLSLVAAALSARWSGVVLVALGLISYGMTAGFLATAV